MVSFSFVPLVSVVLQELAPISFLLVIKGVLSPPLRWVLILLDSCACFLPQGDGSGLRSFHGSVLFRFEVTSRLAGLLWYFVEPFFGLGVTWFFFPLWFRGGAEVPFFS